MGMGRAKKRIEGVMDISYADRGKVDIGVGMTKMADGERRRKKSPSASRRIRDGEQMKQSIFGK